MSNDTGMGKQTAYIYLVENQVVIKVMVMETKQQHGKCLCHKIK